MRVPTKRCMGKLIAVEPEILRRFATEDRLQISLRLMEEPEYLICLQCETPTYQFEYVNGKLSAVVCNTCGNDDITDFLTEAEYEEQTGA